jgi:hypothetical protein
MHTCSIDSTAPEGDRREHLQAPPSTIKKQATRRHKRETGGSTLALEAGSEEKTEITCVRGTHCTTYVFVAMDGNFQRGLSQKKGAFKM